MQHLRLHYEPGRRAWVIDCPTAPKPAQMWWLRRWALEPKHLQHLLSVQADETTRTEALLALQRGDILPNVLGARMTGVGDLVLFEAPRQ